MILSIMEPEIAVIGAGPAGVACTIQLARFGYYPTLFERGEIGGLGPGTLRASRWRSRARPGL